MTHHPRVATTFITDEIDQLERLGFEVVPIAMNPPTDADLLTPEAREASRRTLHLKAEGVPRLAAAFLRCLRAHPIGVAHLVVTALSSARLDLAVAVRRLAHLLYAARTLEHCRSRGAVHIHAHFGLAPATIAWFATELGNLDAGERRTWSFTIHGFHDFVDEDDARLDLKARSASFVACVSDFTRSQLCRVTDPTLWDRFHVVRCGIDLTRFSARHTPSHRERPRIVVVARLSPEKGHLVLVRALRELHDDGLTPQLEIIGSGPFEESIRREAHRLGLGDSVHLLGELAPGVVTERLVDADLFCLPSFSEGLPVSIMEAMAVGLPVVCTGISGVPELAVDDATALTVPPANVSALATAIGRLLRDPALGERLAVEARRVVGERHELGANVGRLAALFEPTWLAERS